MRRSDERPKAGDQLPSLPPARLPPVSSLNRTFQLPGDVNPLTQPIEGSVYGGIPTRTPQPTPSTGVVRAAGSVTDEVAGQYPVAQGAYHPENDTTRLAPASTTQETGLSRLTPTGGPNPGVKL